MVRVQLLTVVNLLIQVQLSLGDVCCSTCLAQPLIAGVDAVNWTACSAAKSICCFDNVCRSWSFGAPNYNLAQITFVGSTAQIPSGSWLQVNWPAATNVSYMVLKSGQPKISQVLNTSLSAIYKDNYYFMCANVPGILYYRGFSDHGCRASTEMYVEIIPGNGTKCDALPTPPASTVECDPVRGAVKNGVCTCIADNSGPPQCLANSWTKLAAEYTGIAAAIVSICGAAYGFYRQRQHKIKNQQENEIPNQEKNSSSHVSHQFQQDATEYAL
ncbi:hypothetical protein THRCLA_11518 [Thraustotheca clavata]|uniref:Secreted protein n=1 Tax=Thraustotheca clavata TaxID=74557 RepID=A0A1V9Y7I5_9STRA|nr:hypothetical protein THRCLA_11518 [Thraustotheca clavata]